MNAPKSAPIQRGELSPEEAERFASMFKPIWELDDAPFAQARSSGISPSEMQQLGKAGVDLQLAQGAFATAPHAPPAAHRPTSQPDASVLVDVEPDPTPPPPVKPPVPQAKPAKPPPPAQAQAPARPRRSVPPAAVRAHVAPVDDDITPPKKSNMGLFAGIGVVALLVIGGVAYKAMGSSNTDAAKPVPSDTKTSQQAEPRIPPPPPPVDTTTAEPPKNTAATTTAPPKTDTTPKNDTTTAKNDPPPPPTPKNTATASPKPPPPPPTTKPTTATGTKPPPKSGGGGIVRDNPF